MARPDARPLTYHNGDICASCRRRCRCAGRYLSVQGPQLSTAMSDPDDLRQSAQQDAWEARSGQRDGPVCKECGRTENDCSCPNLPYDPRCPTCGVVHGCNCEDFDSDEDFIELDLDEEEVVLGPTPWQVICREHGAVSLTQEQYEYQMSRVDSLWKCPHCGASAQWDDDNYEAHLNKEQS